MSEADFSDSDARSALLELADQLRAEIDQSEDGAKPVDLDEPIGRLSRIDAIAQQNMAKANREAAKLRLGQVEAALRRLDAGEYGVCLECEDDISPARLRARPEALLCLGCQAQRESAG